MLGGVSRAQSAVAAAVLALLVAAEFAGGFTSSGFNALKRNVETVARRICVGNCGNPKVKPPTTQPLYAELSIVPSEFDIQTELLDSAAAPLSNGAVGIFSWDCGSGSVSRDDPVVAPGRPGASHLQQFYGNTAATAASGYSTLRSSGSSTCTSRLDRSHYALPAMLDGRGNVVRPDFVRLTYQRLPLSDTKCQPSTDSNAVGICIPLPNGLRFAFGYNAANPTSQQGNPRFACEGSRTEEYSSLATAAANCSAAGSKLATIIEAPSCWDGKNLDSADHRSHVAYPSAGWFGGAKCPSTHPFHIPALSMKVSYSVDESIAHWRFSSDETVAGAQPGTTFQARWYGAWDNKVMAMWTDGCINRRLNCSGGNLGNGRRLRPGADFSTIANPRLIPLGTTSSRKILASEGDSISYTWGGNHTGIYAGLRKDALTHCGLAVGGSGINSMNGRTDGVINCNPQVLTVLIGANDLWDASSADAYLNNLFAYTDKFRSRGIKVAVGTILPQYIASNPVYNPIFNARRAEVNRGIRAAAGSRIDAVIDFAADPVMGPDEAAKNTSLYHDGVHPTDGCGVGCGGQGKLAAIYTPVVDQLLAQP